MESYLIFFLFLTPGIQYVQIQMDLVSKYIQNLSISQHPQSYLFCFEIQSKLSWLL